MTVGLWCSRVVVVRVGMVCGSHHAFVMLPQVLAGLWC